MTAYEFRAYEADGSFIYRPAQFSAANVDALIEHIKNLVSLIGTADALTPVQKEMILSRVYGAEASSAIATLNSLKCIRRVP